MSPLAETFALFLLAVAFLGLGATLAYIFIPDEWFNRGDDW